MIQMKDKKLFKNMPQDRETPAPLEMIDLELAEKLKKLQDLNGLTDDDIDNLALVLAGENEECKIQLFEHQKNHREVLERLEKIGLKIRREKVNKYEEGQSANLKIILR